MVKNKMKVIMVEVSSINGKMTHGLGENIYEWSSKEDRDYFFDLIDKNNLIVMGSGTYNAVKPVIKLSPDKLRVILTRNLGKYKKETIKNILEFSSETPRKLVARLGKKYKKMLLVGGAQIVALFLKEGLIDEIYLTVEPVVFGSGKPLFAEGNFEANLILASIKKLNKKGTLLLKYVVEK